MKVSNFKITKTIAKGIHGDLCFGEVDVTTGFLWWEKTEVKQIFKECYYWRFLDTGEYIPLLALEALESVYRAQQSLRQAHTKPA
jgi:hypothetical protein